MSRIIVESPVALQLQQAHQVVELCDPTGRVLGRFVPSVDLSQWEASFTEIDEEELDRRAKSKELYTTKQVLDHLKNLE